MEPHTTSSTSPASGTGDLKHFRAAFGNIAESTRELKPRQVVILLVWSAAVWFAVAQYIRYGGAAGAFTGNKAISTYIATFLFTIPLNSFTRQLAGAPAEKMLTVAAIGVIVPPTLEGIVMHWFPEFYGGDPVVIGAGAVWLLFAIGIGLGLAGLTSVRARARLRAGDRAPKIFTQSIEGMTVEVPDSRFGLTHVQFLRFAGCPLCNLQLQSYIKRNAELKLADVREVIFFHSDEKYIEDYYHQLPFDVIADRRRRFYKQYAVERSPFSILSPMAWPNLIRGYRLKPAGKIDSTPFSLPAEFLIDGNGTIVAGHYGEHASDQWSVDDVLALTRGIEEQLTLANSSRSTLCSG